MGLQNTTIASTRTEQALKYAFTNKIILFIAV